MDGSSPVSHLYAPQRQEGKHGRTRSVDAFSVLKVMFSFCVLPWFNQDTIGVSFVLGLRRAPLTCWLSN